MKNRMTNMPSVTAPNMENMYRQPILLFLEQQGVPADVK
jgi:hypothetical protein